MIFINTVKAVNKKIDILVNNAGIIMRKPAAEHPDEYWDKVIDKKINDATRFLLKANHYSYGFVFFVFIL